MQHFSIVPNKQCCHAEPWRWQGEKQNQISDKGFENDLKWFWSQTTAAWILSAPLLFCINDQCDARPSVHHPQGATLVLLLYCVALSANSHIWNFKLYCTRNISRLGQVYADTGIIPQKENHFGVIFHCRAGGWQLRDVAIVGKKILNHFISKHAQG